MLLPALHKYARDRELLDHLPFQRRTVHLLIQLRPNGSLRVDGLHLLTTPVSRGRQTREEIGQEVWLPRFPGENNGGRAYYLAESYWTVLGLRKETGEPLPDEPEDRQDRNPVLAYRHFWQRVQDAYERTKDDRLKALLAFRRRDLDNRTGFGR